MKPATQSSQKEAATSFLRLAASGRVREAFDAYVDPTFRHLNVYFRGDAKSLAAGMEENAAEHPNKVLEVREVLEDGDRVTVLSRVRLDAHGPDYAVMHIFRFQNGRVVELWDVAQEIPADSPNPNGAF